MNIKQWPVIRHLRWFYFRYKYQRWWDEYAHWFYAVPNPSDLKFLEDVWYGRA